MNVGSMFDFIKKNFLYIIILFQLNNNLITGEDECDPNAPFDEEIETYRSGIERAIQLPEKIMGDDSEEKEKSPGIIADTFNAVLDKLKPEVDGIVPGTLWCGNGDIAPNSSYIGPCNDTDACCRAHDNCPIHIASGESYGRLKNNGIFSRLPCKCDHAFYECLKEAKSVVSAAIGDSYFNVFRPQCFTCEYPIVGCAEEDGSQLFDKKCLAYYLDTNQNKTLQWFDNLNF